MKIEWMFDLPTDEKSQDYHYESPILIKDNNLYFISLPSESFFTYYRHGDRNRKIQNRVHRTVGYFFKVLFC